jgi:uncharacterized protein (TIGR01777 family)
VGHGALTTRRSLAVGVTGASGFLGRELCAHLSQQGHRVVRFVRPHASEPAGPAEPAASPAAAAIAWDPARSLLDPIALAPLDAVIHLSGAGLADRPWTDERKRELVDSRVRSTELLARALAHTSDWPRARHGARVLVSASAVGWYGNRGDETLDEASAAGSGFLADLARRWEAAAEPARTAGVRVVCPRMGLVLWPGAGVLGKLARPFRFGIGGPLGSGRAWWSWIALPDLLRVLSFALEHDTLAGACNAVTPHPVRQREMARALGRALSRPALLPAPAFALRALLGRERADEMLLASQRVLPTALLAAGFVFEEPELSTALKRMYARPRVTGVR